MPLHIVPDGTITSPRGFAAGATHAGLKTLGERPLDLGILLSDTPCVVAGMFTTNVFQGASLVLTRERVTVGSAQALIVNSGNANAGTGEQGMHDAEEIASLTAAKLALPVRSVLVGSTGVIGVPMPMPLVRAGIEAIQVSANGGRSLAQAITTTDTFPKERAVSFMVDGHEVSVGGIAKGAGMIHPNMATLLAFLTTDAAVEPSFLRQALRRAVDRSLNMVTIDGDTSPDDMVVIFANGVGGNDPLNEGHPGAADFLTALEDVCRYLAVCIARDGEGATRLLTIEVTGAQSEEDARLAARTIAGSMLVKSAVHGADPNWGRLIAALGRSGAHVVPEKIGLYLDTIPLVREGRSLPFDREDARQHMLGREVLFRLDLGLGQGQATAWGCDLSEEYVTFNSAYTT